MLQLSSQFNKGAKKRRFRGFPIISATIIFIFVLVAFLGESLAPYPPNEVDLKERFIPPFWQEGGRMDHCLGTDMLGRDMLSRMIVGARISFIVAILTLALGGVVGTILGIISGYYGGMIDSFLMRAADSTLAFPIMLLAMLLAVLLGPSLQNVVIALGIVLWARFARIIRGEALSFKERDFVALARVAGLKDWQIMIRHLFPNIRNTLVVLITLQVGWVIILEASLSKGIFKFDLFKAVMSIPASSSNNLDINFL